MTNIFYLCNILTDFQLKLLDLIQCLREDIKKAELKNPHRDNEPILTLQYSYIVSLFECSHATVKIALARMEELELITQVTKKYNQCTTYRYNPSVYASLVRQEKRRKCTLTTGRKKQREEVTASKVVRYMKGKAITKAEKLRKKPS